MMRHAIHVQDKAARRASILAAARELFLRAPDRLPSAALIASAAGLAKGTAYLYFRTKEEIFMTLLLQEWGGVVELVHHAFRADEHPRKRKVSQFLSSYADYLHAHPELLKLEALKYGILERNLTPGLLRSFKTESAAALAQAGQAVDAALALPMGRGIRLLIHTYALTLGLWQSLDSPQACHELGDESALALPKLDFQIELQTALAQYWHGLEAAR